MCVHLVKIKVLNNIDKNSNLKNILIACEESQVVCNAFRAKGYEAYSCDIIECSGGHPEWHIKGDVLPLLNGKCVFETMDGTTHKIDKEWDLIIAHPPCTDLAVSGARHFEKKRLNGSQEKSIRFFASILAAECMRLAVENPIGIISGDYIKKWFPEIAEQFNFPIKPTQIIQPYEYGHPVRKSTCLWLKNLPPLQPTNIVDFECIHSKGKSGGYSGNLWLAKDENGKILSYNDPRTARIRSRTYEGIAQAMAEQWG